MKTLARVPMGWIYLAILLVYPLLVYPENVLFRLTEISIGMQLTYIFIYALLSMVAPGTYSPATSILESLCEPILGRIRQTLPAIGGLDLSPLWAGIGIQVLLILLR